MYLCQRCDIKQVFNQNDLELIGYAFTKTAHNYSHTHLLENYSLKNILQRIRSQYYYINIKMLYSDFRFNKSHITRVRLPNIIRFFDMFCLVILRIL